MCGILGLVHAQPPTPSQAKYAIAKIARRGPDHMDSHQIDDDAWFAHSRLSIIDLSSWSSIDRDLYDINNCLESIINSLYNLYNDNRRPYLYACSERNY